MGMLGVIKLFILMVAAIIKIVLGTFLSAFSLALLLSLNTGEPLLGIYFQANTSASAIVVDTIKNIVSKLPFVGYILDTGDIWSGMTKAGGFGVFQDWIKMMLLFVTTHIFYEFLLKYIEKWKRLMEDGGNLATGLNWYADVYMTIVVGVMNAIFTLLFYDWLIEFWISTFGNGFAANSALFAAVFIVFVAIYFLLPICWRASMINRVTEVLLDFGLILCSVVFVCYLGLASKFPAIAVDREAWYYARTALPIVFAVIGFIVLIGIKTRNKKKK